MLTPPSGGGGGFTKLYWGNFILQLLSEILLCLGPTGEFVYDTRFIEECPFLMYF